MASRRKICDKQPEKPILLALQWCDTSIVCTLTSVHTERHTSHRPLSSPSPQLLGPRTPVPPCEHSAPHGWWSSLLLVAAPSCQTPPLPPPHTHEHSGHHRRYMAYQKDGEGTVKYNCTNRIHSKLEQCLIKLNLISKYPPGVNKVVLIVTNTHPPGIINSVNFAGLSTPAAKAHLFYNWIITFIIHLAILFQKMRTRVSLPDDHLPTFPHFR